MSLCMPISLAVSGPWVFSSSRVPVTLKIRAHSIPNALGFEQPLHRLPAPPPPPSQGGHQVGDAPYLYRRIGNRNGQASPLQQRKVWKVITHVRDLSIVQTVPCQQVAVDATLVFDAGMDLDQAQFLGSTGAGVRLPAPGKPPPGSRRPRPFPGGA